MKYVQMYTQIFDYKNIKHLNYITYIKIALNYLHQKLHLFKNVLYKCITKFKNLKYLQM